MSVQFFKIIRCSHLQKNVVSSYNSGVNSKHYFLKTIQIQFTLQFLSLNLWVFLLKKSPSLYFWTKHSNKNEVFLLWNKACHTVLMYRETYFYFFDIPQNACRKLFIDTSGGVELYKIVWYVFFLYVKSEWQAFLVIPGTDFTQTV